MISKFKRLGNYIQLVDERNDNLKITRLLGINISKNFMPSVANTSETDLSKYKIIRKGQFAYSAMQVGRDESIRVALFNEDEPAIISPAYLVFEVIDSNIVIPEFLMMFFQRPETDRYGWFISDGSVRASLEWERFCDIDIPIPETIEEQKKFATIYIELMKNQKAYENSLNDLQLICDIYMDNLVSREESKVLGKFIQQSDEINTNLEVSNLLGISVEKNFFPSKTKQETLELNGYKIIKKNQFGFVTVTSRNGEKLSIALLEGSDGILSSTYVVFYIIDEKELMPEFLYLWFKRPEFDRYARFHSWGSARETFNWEDMCNVKLPIPDLNIQKSIVAVYNVLESRRKINERIKSKINHISAVLIKGLTDKLHIV